MNEIAYRGEGNQPLTNSKLVAEVFEKPHDNVLKAIRALVEQSQPRQLVPVNKPSNLTDMIDKEIKEQLDRIELYSLIAAKNVLNINEADG